MEMQMKKIKPYGSYNLIKKEFYQDGDHIFGRATTRYPIPAHGEGLFDIWLFNPEINGVYVMSRLIVDGEDYDEDIYHNKSYFRFTIRNEKDVDKQMDLQFSFYITEEEKNNG
jgi:hypothetical protein